MSDNDVIFWVYDDSQFGTSSVQPKQQTSEIQRKLAMLKNRGY
jgi:hypothetical protein